MAFNLVNTAVEYIGDATFDMDDTTANKFMVALVKGTWVGATDKSTMNDGVITNLATNAAANTVSLTNVYWNRATNTVTWGADAVTFTASGGTMAADYIVVYQDADAGGGYPATTDKLVGYANIGVQSIATSGTLTIRDTTNSSQIVMFTQKSV